MTDSKANLLGPLCAFTSAVTWSVGVVAYTRLSKTHLPSVINFSRALVALPLFILSSLLASGLGPSLQEAFTIPFENVGWAFASIISSYAIGDVCFLLSAGLVGVPVSMAIASVYPVWSTLLDLWMRGEPAFGPPLVGSAIVFAGSALVILGGYRARKNSPAAVSTKSYFLGIFLAVLTSLFWTLNIYAVAGAGKGISIGLANGFRMAFALCLCPIVTLIWVSLRKMPRPPRPWLSLAEIKKYGFVFALEGFGGAYVFLYGVSHSPMATASALSSLSPVLSVPIAWFLKTEKPTVSKTSGIVLVVIGIWILLGAI